MITKIWKALPPVAFRKLGRWLDVELKLTNGVAQNASHGVLARKASKALGFKVHRYDVKLAFFVRSL